jgi:hypothetical protein
MNPQEIATLAQNFVHGHGRDAAMLVAGAVLSNPGTTALLAFTAVTKIPGVGGWMGRNPDKVKAWLNGFTAKVDELEDKYAAAQTPTPPAAVPGGAPDASKTPSPTPPTSAPTSAPAAASSTAVPGAAPGAPAP